MRPCGFGYKTSFKTSFEVLRGRLLSERTILFRAISPLRELG